MRCSTIYTKKAIKFIECGYFSIDKAKKSTLESFKLIKPTQTYVLLLSLRQLKKHKYQIKLIVKNNHQSIILYSYGGIKCTWGIKET